MDIRNYREMSGSKAGRPRMRFAEVATETLRELNHPASQKLANARFAKGFASARAENHAGRAGVFRPRPCVAGCVTSKEANEK